MTASAKLKPFGYTSRTRFARRSEKQFLYSDINLEAVREAIEGGIGAVKPKKGKHKRVFQGFGASGLPKDRAAQRALRLKLKKLNDVQLEIAKAREKVVRETAAAKLPAQMFEPGARGRVILNGVRIREEDLVSAGGTYSLEQVQELMLGVSRQAVEKRVAEGSLLAVPGPSNRRRYPVAQFNPDGSIVAGMSSVRASLPTTNPWTVLNFLVQPDPRLDGMKPIELMRKGDIELVVESARRVGEQGA